MDWQYLNSHLRRCYLADGYFIDREDDTQARHIAQAGYKYGVWKSGEGANGCAKPVGFRNTFKEALALCING